MAKGKQMATATMRTEELSIAPAVQAQPTHQEDPILNISEVARQIGKSPHTVKRWCLDGIIKALWDKDNRLWGVRKSEVNKLLGASALNVQVK